MIKKWHTLLAMEKHDRAWYENDLADELNEYYEEKQFISRWSELSDIVYVCSRAKWAGYRVKFPLSVKMYYFGVIYMAPKYTGRWLFFRVAGRKAKAYKIIREVRNPKKVHKLRSIAEANGVNTQLFQEICEKQLKYWPLLP